MNKPCILCGWPLNDEHVFNVKCAAANAEAEQVEAEARELQSQPTTPEDERLLEIGLEAAREALAYARFKREVQQP